MAAENWIINVLQKLKELGKGLASFGGSMISKAYGLFPSQKVQQCIQGAIPNMKVLMREIRAENLINFLLEKLKELGMVLVSFGGSVISKAYDLFPTQKVQQWIQGAVPNMKAKAREIWAENSINLLPEKLKELGLVVENYGGILGTKVVDEMFPFMIKELQIWFQVAKPYIFPVAVLLCFYCCSRCCGGVVCGGLVKMMKVFKMMKAPGRDFRLPRALFEMNPSLYFRGLRGNRVVGLHFWFQVAKPYVVRVAVVLLCFYCLRRCCGGGGGGGGGVCKMMKAPGGNFTMPTAISL